MKLGDLFFFFNLAEAASVGGFCGVNNGAGDPDLRINPPPGPTLDFGGPPH